MGSPRLQYLYLRKQAERHLPLEGTNIMEALFLS